MAKHWLTSARDRARGFTAHAWARLREAKGATAVLVGAAVGIMLRWMVTALSFTLSPRAVLPNWPMVVTAAALIALAAAIYTVPTIWAALRRWGHRRELLPVDLGLIALVLLVAPSLYDQRVALTGRYALATVVALVISALLVRTIVALRTTVPGRTVDEATALFQVTLGDDGFSPLADFSSDALGREPLLAALTALIRFPRAAGFTVGLEGPWGSGKTTLLNALDARLRSIGFITVRLDAWDYRDPDNIVEAYFNALSAALRRWAYLPGLRRSLNRLARGLMAAGGPRSAGIFAAVVRRQDSGIDASRKDVADAIGALDRPVVVFVDDLDRLDPPEVMAVLRAIRLVATTPVTHILAYDRRQLARAIAADKADSTLAREYLAKLVNLEVPLPEPRDELRLQFLEDALRPLLNSAQPDVATEFVDRLSSAGPLRIARAIDTPRELRRIAAATAWKWNQLTPHVNLFDLFIVTLLQYRFPAIYKVMHSRPEWFTNVRWSSNFAIAIEYERHNEDRDAYISRLQGSEDRDDILVVGLLKALGIYSGMGGDEHPALKSRSLIHPEIFPRYFQLGILPTDVTEKSLEDIGQEIVAETPGPPRQQKIVSSIRDAISADRVRGFLDQWPLAGDVIRRAQNDEILRDVALAFAQAMSDLPGEENDFFAPRATARAIVRDALTRMSGDDVATDVAVEVIQVGSDLGLAGDLVFYSADAEAIRRDRAFGGKRLDAARLRSALDDQIRTRLAERGPLVAHGDALVAVVYRASPEVSTHFILRDLGINPMTLPTLLALAIKLHPSEFADSGFDLFDNGLPSLAKHVNLDAVNELTRSVPTAKWTDPMEAALVSFFRDWMRQDKPLSPP